MLSHNEDRLYALLNDETLLSQVLAIIHQDEQDRRTAIIQRQREGLQQARNRGVRLGRPPLKKPKKFAGVRDLYQRHQISARAAAQVLGVSPITFVRWIKEESSE